MRRRQGFATVSGTRLYYEASGRGAALVFVHGFTLDSRMWNDQCEVFAQDYQVLRYDMRGFGQSDLPTASFAHADDLKALLDHLGIAEAAILGLSMGGEMAINFALAYPESTRALIVADTALGGYARSPEFIASLEPIYAAARAASIEAAKELWLAQPLFTLAHQQPAVAARLRHMVDDYAGWHLIAEARGQGLDPPAARRLDEITAPTLIIVGEHDLPDFQAIADLLERDIPHSQKVVTQSVGHMTSMEDPRRFSDIALRFLAEQ